MSRAFVREDTDAPVELPDLPMSSYPNLVTPRGAAMMERKIAEMETELANLPGDDAIRRPLLKRDLRYWMQRRATARVTQPPASGAAQVGFGSRVTLRRAKGAVETLEIVGEDEADPTVGRISWVSPVAKALKGAEAGDVVTVGSGPAQFEITIHEVANG